MIWSKIWLVWGDFSEVEFELFYKIKESLRIESVIFPANID